MKEDWNCVGPGTLARPAEQSSAVHAAVSSSIAASGRGRPRHTGWLRHFAATLVCAIREIFDESAYERFLRRTQTTSCAQSYAAFRHEHEELKARRPRCC